VLMIAFKWNSVYNAGLGLSVIIEHWSKQIWQTICLLSVFTLWRVSKVSIYVFYSIEKFMCIAPDATLTCFMHFTVNIYASSVMKL